MKESDFGHKFINDFLKPKYPFLWGMKVHGHEMQASDIPDNLFCINGIFVAIEFKVQRDGRITTTPGQMKEIVKIKDAGGVGLFVAYDENRNKILVRERRLDYKKIFFSEKVVVGSKKKSIKIDWDFEFNKYEDAIELLHVMILNSGG